jgi:hypothetical protein
MKKNLHRIIMSALLTVLATVAASAQCYIVGSDNEWKTNTAAAELAETATTGVYEGDVTFVNGAQYFTVTQHPWHISEHPPYPDCQNTRRCKQR